MKQTLDITGMTCAACAAAVEKSVGRLDGVDNAAVNFATEKLSVEFDEGKLEVGEVIKAVRDAGYGAELASEGSREGREAERERELKRLKYTFIISAVLSFPMLLAMILHFLGASALGFLHNGYFQLALALPVQFVIGFRFYRGAWHSLKSRSANMDVLVSLGTTAAFVYSLYLMFWGGASEMLYFETSAVVITLILLGRYLETKAKSKTSGAIKSS